MINSLISINIVLQEIIRDLGLGATSIPSSDIKEWIIEALKHIGVAQQNREEIRTITIKDYKGKLPCETYKVVKLLEGCKYNYNENLRRDDDADAKTQNELVAISNSDYNIQFQEIATSFEEGEMKFRLLLFPVDSEGFLLIPDSISYKDALMWKVAYQLGIRGHKFSNNLMNNIEFTGRKWQFYCKQARGSARMGDVRVLEMFNISMNKLIPDLYQYQKDFSGLNTPERLNLDSRSSY